MTTTQIADAKKAQLAKAQAAKKAKALAAARTLTKLMGAA